MRNHRQDNNIINEFIGKLRKEPIANIPLKALVKPPEGYAWKIVKAIKEKEVSISQVRRFYAEIKYISENYKRLGKDEIETRLYMLYPLLIYQERRKVIKNKNFARVIQALLDNLDKYQDEKNFKQAENFMKAIVAYLKE